QLRIRRTIAGLFLELAQRSLHGLLAILDDTCRKLERHPLHARTELLDQDHLPIRSDGDHVYAERNVDDVELLQVTRAWRAHHVLANTEHVVVTHDIVRDTLPRPGFRHSLSSAVVRRPQGHVPFQPPRYGTRTILPNWRPASRRS